LTPPDHFIWKHLPQDPRWQLLVTPLTKEQFEQAIAFESWFFDYGLELIAPQDASSKVKDSLKILLRSPKKSILSSTVTMNDIQIKGTSFNQKSYEIETFNCIFSKAGEYKVELFVKGFDEEGDFKGCLELRVTAEGSQNPDAGFPHAFGTFSAKNCYLYSPMKKTLVKGTTEIFRIKVPNALNVTVVQDQDIVALDQENDDDIWQGSVEIVESKITIFGHFPDGSSLEGLISYNW